MRIALLANGTRGDVQPMLTLGEELLDRGHEVVMTVNENLVAWASRSRLEVVSLPLDSEALLRSEQGIALLASGETIRLNAEMSRLDLLANLPMLEAFTRCCRGADLILSTGLTMFRGATLAEYFGVPHAVVATMPWINTCDFPMLLAPLRSLGARWLNRASYPLYLHLWWKAGEPAIAEMRRALGMPVLEERPRIEALPTIGIYSSELSPRPAEWSAEQPITGFITPTRELRVRLGEGAMPAGLETWLNAGQAPVYFGFGSMPIQHPQRMLEMVAQVTRQKGLRALIGAGWSHYTAAAELDMDHVFVAPAFDHDRVLPLCRAAVHHGGAGTTAAVLRAGLPSLIATVFADQPYWAWRVEQLGAGIKTRFRDLKPLLLDEALDRLLTFRMRDAAQGMGEVLRTERGARRAADVIESWGGRGSRAPQRTAA